MTLVLALIAAALLRFWALPQGIPFGLGVDEPEVMNRSVRMIKTGDFNPHFFDYPGFYLYLQAVVVALRFVWGAVLAQWSSLAQASTDNFYLWGRAVTAMLGTATVWLVYEAGRRWDHRTATLAAALLAVMPLHVRESHYVLTDVPTTFFVAQTFVLSLRAHEGRTAWSFAIAGMMAGLAGATKYTGILALVMPLLSCVLSERRKPSRAASALLVLAGCAGAFLVAAPYTLLDLPTFLNQFARLASEYRTPTPGVGPAWIVYLKHLRIALDWPGSILVITGLGVTLLRAARGPHRAAASIAVAFPLLYFYFVSHQYIIFARYLLPIVPFLCLFSASAVAALVDRVSRERIRPAFRLALAAGLVFVAMVPPAYTSFRYDADAARVWTAELAYNWIRQNIPAGSVMTTESGTLFLPADYRVQRVTQLRTHTVADYTADGVQYLVSSSQCYGPYLERPGVFPVEYGDYARLFQQTRELARFTPSRDHPGPELRVLKVVSH